MAIETQDFHFLSEEIRKASGIALTEDKAYLMESRLIPVLKKHRFRGLAQLAQRLRTESDDALLEEIAQAITTNQTWFFRDIKVFDHMRKELFPALVPNVKKKGTIRVWSAGCSSGQEAYSVAIALLEELQVVGKLNAEILGTDLVPQVVSKAKEGIYTQFEVQRGMPVQLMLKYFDQKDESWLIKPQIRKHTKFQVHNLLNSYQKLGKFDLILCRNVLSYFSEEMRIEILDKLVTQLEPYGTLILGTQEMPPSSYKKLKPLDKIPGIFEKI